VNKELNIFDQPLDKIMSKELNIIPNAPRKDIDVTNLSHAFLDLFDLMHSKNLIWNENPNHSWSESPKKLIQNELELHKCDNEQPPSKYKTESKSKLKKQISIENTKTLLNLISNDIGVKDENKDNLVKEEITKLNYLKKLY